MNPEFIVKVSLDIGAAMIKSGAETMRVEDTITRICQSYHSGKLDVTSYSNAIFVTMEVTDWIKHPDSPRIVTQHRRVNSISNDLAKLEELNALSRYICENTPEPWEVDARMEEIMGTTQSIRRGVIGYLLASGGFTIFFGGNFFDAICCSLISLILYTVDRCLKSRFNNELIRVFVLSFVAGFPACLLELSPLSIHMDKIMIGSVMLLIPGVALTNSLRDLFTGDVASGALKLLNSILIAIAVALGFAVSMVVTGV